MDKLYVLAGSLAAVSLMVAFAWVLGFRRAARIDRAELERLLALAEPGGRIEDAVIASDRRAALARLADGKLLAAKSMGGDVSVRIYPTAALTVRLAPRRISAAFADLGFPTLNVRLEHDPPPWLAELAAAAEER